METYNSTCGLARYVGRGVVVLLWVYVPHDYKAVYEIIPGFLLSFLTIVAVSLFDKPVTKEVQEEFDQVKTIVQS